MTDADPRATHAVVVKGVVKHLADSAEAAVRIAQQAAQGGEAGVVTAKALADGAVVWTSETAAGRP